MIPPGQDRRGDRGGGEAVADNHRRKNRGFQKKMDGAASESTEILLRGRAPAGRGGALVSRQLEIGRPFTGSIRGQVQCMWRRGCAHVYSMGGRLWVVRVVWDGSGRKERGLVWGMGWCILDGRREMIMLQQPPTNEHGIHEV